MRLELNNVSKRYRSGTIALNEVSIRLGRGSFGLLGPNGAGKSTMMEIIAGLLKPTSGSIKLGDLTPEDDVEAYRLQIGYLPQRFGFPPGATVRSVLSYLGQLRGLGKREGLNDRVSTVIRQLNLEPKANSRVSTLSGGMRQRLGIAQALIHNPAVLILDEPTVGLDLDERERLLLLLSDYAKQAIVIFSTHLIDDVEAVCQSVGFITDGRLLDVQTRSEILMPLHERIYSAAHDEPVQAHAPLYETIRDGKRVRRYFVESSPVDPGLTRCEPSIRDAYALRIPTVAT